MKNRTLIVIASFLAFWIFGFTDILKGSVLPKIIQEGWLDYSNGGLLLGFTYFGFFAGTLGSVFLLKKGFAPYLMFAAVVISCAGAFLFGSAFSAALLFPAIAIIGIGSGLIDVAANLTVRLNSPAKNLGRNMNLLGFFHGLGAVMAPLYAAAYFSRWEGWKGVYLAAAALVLALVIFIGFAVFSTYPKKESGTAESESGSWNKLVLLLGGVLFFYMTVEAGIAGWLVEYNSSVLGYGESRSQFSLSLFFILLTVGRLLTSLYADRLGLARTLTLNIAAAALCAGLGVAVNGASILIPVTGLFLAPVFPSTAALISTVLHESGVRRLGYFFSIGGLGGLLGPWIIGTVARNVGLEQAYWLLLPLALTSLLFMAVFQRKYSGRNHH